MTDSFVGLNCPMCYCWLEDGEEDGIPLVPHYHGEDIPMNRSGLASCVLLIVLILCVQPALAIWQTDGNLVCDRANDQEYIELISDGSYGVIMVWKDGRLSAAAPDIFAQRFNNMGEAVWPEDGVAICTANNIQEYPRLAPDGAGGAIIAWTDNRWVSGRDIFAQRIDASGTVQWDANGVWVGVETGWQFDPRVISDGAGGAIIAWQDRRTSGTTGTDIYVQRINSAGAAQWATNGVVVCSATGDQITHDIVSDGAGGAILTWEDQRTFSDIYAQRIDASGNAMWTADGIVVALPSYVANPKIVSDTKHGAIIAWEDNRTYRDIYAQRIRADGTPLWTADGIAMCPSASGYQIEMRLAPDGEGGAIMVLMDNREGSEDHNIYAQKVDSSGTILWNADGAGVCTAAGDQDWPDVAGDGEGGAIFTWEDERGTDEDVYAQRIAADGTVAWSSGGIGISLAADIQRQARIIPDGLTGAYIAWVDERSTSKDIFVSHVNKAGQVPTLLASFWTSVAGHSITVGWSLSEAGVRLSHRIFRAAGNAGFEELQLTPTAQGMEFTITDRDVRPGQTYRYRVYSRDSNGESLLFTTEPLTAAPVALRLEQNYPNPFKPGTSISFSIPAPARVVIAVFDVSGRYVATVTDKRYPAGTGQVSWDGTDDTGARVGSGVFFYRLSVGKKTLTKKMIMMH